MQRRAGGACRMGRYSPRAVPTAILPVLAFTRSPTVDITAAPAGYACHHRGPAPRTRWWGTRTGLERAVDEISAITQRLLLEELATAAGPRDRETERMRARERGQKREQQVRERIAGEG